MYMSPQCTKFSNELISAIQQVNLKFLLICNICVNQNKCNVLIDRLKNKPEKAEETKESTKTVIEETLQNNINEIELTKLSYKEALEKQANEHVKQVSDPKNELNDLIRGLDELNDKDLRVRIEHDRAKINHVVSFLNINTKFTDCKRVGKYKPKRHRPLLVTMPSVLDKKLLHSALARLKSFDKKST